MKRIGILSVIVVMFVAGAVWANRSSDPLPSDARADLIVVEKGKRLLTLYANGTALNTYRIALGREPAGAKESEGDDRTPEGRYVIDSRNAQSAFHRALHISYPSDVDAARAREGGYSPGGAIMIHGIRKGLGWLGRAHRVFDWTRGCIAVTNDEIEELWRVVPDGTPIEIRP
jgi:murein L,D-transpeptidase YafK